MNFQDRDKASVQSLLALLRSTQDVGTTTAPARPADASVAAPRTATTGHIPSQQQLQDLLQSINGPKSGSAPNLSAGGVDIAPKSSRNLIEPFGPVGAFPTSSSAIAGYSSSPAPTSTPPRGTKPPEVESPVTGSSGRGGVEARGAEWDMMPFAKALPVLSGLISNETFMLEVKKMKADQDALERRLWAKQEKVKAEHERSIQAERDIARIAQRPIPSEKRAQWAANLDLNLQDFYRQTCLPSFDSLAKRHRDRLIELGVPGLGGQSGDEKDLARWRRIMDLLQAGLEE